MAQNGSAGKSEATDYSSIPATAAIIGARVAALRAHRESTPATDAYYAGEFARELSNMAKSYENARDVVPDDRAMIAQLSKEWQAGSLPVLQGADVVSLTIMLDACRKLYIVPDKEWLHAWQARSLEMMSHFGLQRLANIFHDHAQCQIVPTKEWYAAWQAETIRQMSSGERGHAAMLFDHALLGIEPTAEWLEAWTKVAKTREFDTTGTRSILLAHRGLGWPDPDWLAVDLHALQAETMQNEASFNERRFAQQLRLPKFRQRMHGVLVSSEEWNPHSLSLIDFVLREKSPSGRDQVLYVQIDGPTHFMVGADGERVVRPTTALQTRILERDMRPGEALIRLSHREFELDPEKATKRALDALGDIARPAVNGKHGKGKKYPLYPAASHTERVSRPDDQPRGR